MGKIEKLLGAAISATNRPSAKNKSPEDWTTETLRLVLLLLGLSGES